MIVDTGGGPVTLPWSARQLQLDELRRVAGTEKIVQAFEDVGASQFGNDA